MTKFTFAQHDHLLNAERPPRSTMVDHSEEKCKGVSFNKKNQKWWSYLDENNQRTNLGYFKLRADAVAARHAAEDDRIS